MPEAATATAPEAPSGAQSAPETGSGNEPTNFFDNTSKKNRDAQDFLRKNMEKIHEGATDFDDGSTIKPEKPAKPAKPVKLEPPPMDEPELGDDGLGKPNAADDDEAGEYATDETDAGEGAGEEQQEELDSRLVNVARSLGIRDNELEGLTNDSLASVLQMVTGRMREMRSANGQPPAGEAAKGEAGKKGAADKPFRFDYKREEVAPELVEVIDKMTDHYETQIAELKKNLADHGEWRKGYEEKQAQERQERDRKEFVGVVQKFTTSNPAFKDLFGDGSLERTTPQQKKALQSVAQQMDVLAKGYEFSRGTPMPPMEQLFQMAAYALHGNRFKSHATAEIAGQLQDRARGIQPQGSGSRSTRGGPPAEGDNAAKSWLESHGRKIGLW